MVNTVVHVYFGDHHRHPIVNNYLNTLSYRQLVIDSKKSNKGRFSRLLGLVRLLFKHKKDKNVVFHTHDLLSFYLVKTIFPLKPILFDSHEVYRCYFGRFLYYLVYILEEMATCICSYKFIPSVDRARLYKINKKTFVVENLFVPKHPPCVATKKQNTFVYGGLLSEQRCIRELVQMFEKIPSCFLTIYGQKNSYMNKILKMGLPVNVEYKGEIAQDELLEELPKYTASFALYKPVDLNNKFPAPTKLFENEYLGIPTIVFDSPYVNRLIASGVLVNTCILGKIDDLSFKKILGSKEIYNCRHNQSKSIIWN